MRPVPLELAEVLPRRPAADEVAVGDQHARRARVRAEHADRLAALHEQRLVVLERAQRCDDRVERLPAARRLPGAAVDDEVVRPLGDVGIEVVHQHAERGFLLPALAGELGAARRADGARRRALRARSSGRRSIGHAAPSRCRRTARARSRCASARDVAARARGRCSSGAHERAHARVRARDAAARLAAARGSRGPAPRTSARWRARARTLRTTRRSFHAAPIAIGTTSSLLPSVGIVSTLAGCDSTLHSLASAAAVTCAIMKPEFTPGVAREERRQPLVEIGMHEPVDAPLGDRREVRQRDRQDVERHRDRLSVKVAAAQQSRRSRTRADCRSRRSARARRRRRRSRARRAPGRAPAACSAAQYGILHARVAVRGATRGSRCRASSARSSAARSPPGRAARARRGCARRTRPACRAAPRATSRRRRARSARGDARRTSASAAIAVCACVPLMSVMPFLRAERHRREPRSLRASSAASARAPSPCSSVAFADQREREVRERREVAARADAALLRDRRIQPGVEHRERAGRRAPAARPSSPWRARSRAAASSRAPRARAAAARRRPRGCARDSPAARPSRSRRDGDLGELAEAGRHAVHDGAATRRARSTIAFALRHARARRGRELHRRALARDRDDVVERERLPVEDHGAPSCAAMSSGAREDNSRARARRATQRSPIPSFAVACACGSRT